MQGRPLSAISEENGWFFAYSNEAPRDERIPGHRKDLVYGADPIMMRLLAKHRNCNLRYECFVAAFKGGLLLLLQGKEVLPGTEANSKPFPTVLFKHYVSLVKQ